MEKPAVSKVALPQGSVVASLPFTDHADAFRARVDPVRFPDVDAFARAFLSQEPPAWIGAAMKARDAVVGTIFGLKTAGEARVQAAKLPSGDQLSLEPGVRAGIFTVLERRPDEILLGEDDRHLDFRVSLFYERDGDDRFVTVSTVVRFNNALGRAYFVPVRPVHGLVVPAMMRRILTTPSLA